MGQTEKGKVKSGLNDDQKRQERKASVRKGRMVEYCLPGKIPSAAYTGNHTQMAPRNTYKHI